MTWPCLSAEIVVTSNSEAALRQAVQTAAVTPGPNRITFFATPGGTIQLTSPLVVTASDLTVEGPVTIDVHGLPLGLDLRGSSITLRRLRVTGISSGGGGLRIVASAQAPLIQDIVIEESDLSSDIVGGNPVGITVDSSFGGPAGLQVSNVRIAGNTFEGFGGDGDGVLIGGRSTNYLIEKVTVERNSFRHCTFPVELVPSAGAAGGRISQTTVRGNAFVANAQAVSMGAIGNPDTPATTSVIEQTLIEDNTFIDDDHGIVMMTANGATDCRTENTTIRHNTFGGHYLFAITLGAGGGGTQPTRGNINSNTTIEANRMSDGSVFGAYVVMTADGTQDNTITDLKFVNNIVTGCGTGIAILGVANGNRIDNVVLANNTVAFNRGAGITFAAAKRPGIDAVNNIVWGNAPDFGGSPENDRFNILVDPLFVDPADDNWSLRAGSAAIDAGTTDGAPATDYFGQARCGAAPDVGAIEHCPSRRRRAAP